MRHRSTNANRENELHLHDRDTMHRFAVALFLAVVVAGPALADNPQVEIALKDHQWMPKEVPVPAGVKVELIIRNEQATAAEFESTSLHREKVVPAGGQARIFVGPLSPGRYEFFDDFHTASRGFLVVK